MGSPPIAAEELELLAGQHEICGVVCQPDKPVGRHAVLTAPESKVTATALGIPVFQPDNLKDERVIQWISGHCAQLIVVVAYGKILPRALLELPRYGCINLHASLLPKYRGAAPLQHALLNGDSETGLSIMKLVEGMDTGPVLLQRSMPIGEEDDIDDLFRRAAQLGGQMILEAIQKIEQGTAQYTEQDESLASYAPALTKNSGWLDFTGMADLSVSCAVRALCRWPVAYFLHEQSHVKVHKAKAVGGSGLPGEVLQINPLIVACKQGAVRIDSVTPEGRKTMSGTQYATGLRIKKGQNILG